MRSLGCPKIPPVHRIYLIWQTMKDHIADDKEYWRWVECDHISGACYSFENAKRHYKYSDYAANEKDFGIAISHLILGMEEAIKSMLLICAHANRYFVPPEEMRQIFISHNFKHLNIKELLVSLSAKRIEAYHENPFVIMDSDDSNKFQTTAHFLSKGLMIEGLQEKEIKSLVNLITRSNEYKNRGFYVDYKADWVNPADIKENEYADYSRVVTKLLSCLEKIFKLPTTDERLQRFLDGNWI
ncbi:MAG: AbiV family abortive infection protein [Sphingobacteriales bacterium]|nr:MAG: AbiV family abortive infection protein [Sphingobacteriales bacterium]